MKLLSLSISIHSLCEEGDGIVVCYLVTVLFQSTPSVKRETFGILMVMIFIEFQSTPSVKRETAIATIANVPFSDFNPLPL